VKIFVTGTRGVPEIPGGVERHCEQLYPIIVKNGHEVFISRRTPYVDRKEDEWKGIKLIDVYAPTSKALEAIVHTFLSVIKARLLNVDIVHIHAVGPALLVPLARMLSLKVVFTNHGPDYDRQKWGWLPSQILRLGEYFGGKFSDKNIVISEVIRQIILTRCKRDSEIIYNGVEIKNPSVNTSYLETIGVKARKYLLAVARFVPEKGLHDLISAYAELDTDFDLVIAGDADHEDDYSLSLKKLASQHRVKLTGYITGDDLHQMYSHAALFVLPSYHEGLPIALLEALSYGLDVLVSDIPANLEVSLENNHYFECGNILDLSNSINLHLASTVESGYADNIMQTLSEKYDWEHIAGQTIDVYSELLKAKT